MTKDSILNDLASYKDRLSSEVVKAYSSRGSAFGNERFASWRRRFSKFLDENLPGQSAILDEKLTHMGYVIRSGESLVDRFWREDGEITDSFIDSLILDIQNDELEITSKSEEPAPMAKDTPEPKSKSVFIVHGHDDLLKTQTARFVEKLGYKAIILHEQANRGQTIIEKIEANTDVGFAIVLYSPDDKGNAKAKAEAGELLERGRQNVVFEHGYLTAKLGRARVATVMKGRIELPGDTSGVVYVTDKEWQLDLAKEMKAAGYNIDFNKIIDV